MARDDKPPPTNMRRYRRQSERKLLALVIFALVVVGGGLIALIYGPGALLTALPCLLGGAALILGLWLLFSLVERWLKRLDRVGRSDPEARDRTSDLEENKPAEKE